ncbi:MAG TPA: hypothetical protein VGH79_07255 [Gaiellaceae bacterium]|jgi:hypothetical protein
MTESLPPQRDLPPGRLEARRRHLVAEIAPRSSRTWPRVAAFGVAAAAVVAAIAVPLTVGGSEKPSVKIVYRPVPVIVAWQAHSGLTLLSEGTHRDVTTLDGRHYKTLFERFVNGLAAEGRHVRLARRAQPAITRAEAVAAMWPGRRRTSGAWVVHVRMNGHERLAWLLAIRHGCVQSYGPVGGRYRTMWAGFVDATTGRPLYRITVGGGRARPC